MSRSDTDYLRHILDELRFLVTESRSLDVASFLQDETRKRAFVRSLEVIGEASKNLSDALRARYPDVEWRLMARMRDRLIHGYFGVDYEIVWDVAVTKAPVLAVHIERIIEHETGEADDLPL